jgi:hypothetical protein
MYRISGYKPVVKSTNVVEIQSLDGGAYLRYSSNITPSYKNLQFWLMYIYPQKAFLQPYQGVSKLQPNQPLIGLG